MDDGSRICGEDAFTGDGLSRDISEGPRILVRQTQIQNTKSPLENRSNRQPSSRLWYRKDHCIGVYSNLHTAYQKLARLTGMSLLSGLPSYKWLYERSLLRNLLSLGWTQCELDSDSAKVERRTAVAGSCRNCSGED